jgi:hypothetical protein
MAIIIITNTNVLTTRVVERVKSLVVSYWDTSEGLAYNASLNLSREFQADMANIYDVEYNFQLCSVANVVVRYFSRYGV